MTKEFKSASATKIKNRFGDYLGEVIYRREPVLIERHGKPVAVIVDFDEWKKLRNKKEKKEHPWIKRLDELNEEYLKNHPDAKPWSAVDLINEIREDESKRLL